MADKMQPKLDGGEKKIELTATTLQILIKNTPKEKGWKPRNREWEDDKNKKEIVEKSTAQTDQRVD